MIFNIQPMNPHKKGVLRQYMASMAASFAFTLIGSAVAWPSPILIKMKNGETPITLDYTQISWMVSVMFLGHMLSPVPSGYLMDRFGRKHTSLALSILPLVSWILIYYGETPLCLYIARFCAGMWNGITSTIVPLYIGEIAEADVRGSLNTLNNAFTNVGILFTFVIGPFVSYQMLAIISGLAVVFYFCFYIYMPESPHFYVMSNKREKAMNSLKWFRGEGEKIEEELINIENSLKAQMIEKGSVKEIFMNRGNRKAFTIAVGYSVLKKLAGARILQAYASTTLPSVTFGFLDPDECVMILGTISLFCSFSAVYFAAKFNRRTLLNVSSFGTGIVLYVVGIWFYLSTHINIDVSKYDSIVFICFALFNIIFSIGIGPVGTSIKGEMFSANVKALSSSITTVLVAIATFLINKFYLVFAHSIGMYVNYFIYGTSCFLSIWFTLVYVPELQGKTLQEIQDILNGRNTKGQNKINSKHESV